ncbi:hypothetical protein RA28_18975 [Ruegeria sp. ANG-S4]|uniref:hypothetical protein n=1 Tax=Ruegeria sp. ANG-S4 TaxID=1577904 RepID=UPI00057F0344|nr:hypothetical protein [Ruegeria sp. ANG-S4]KIC43725.1 hypothetical protein RA28_18975 [Ruegeria sp. ANG-S4]
MTPEKIEALFTRESGEFLFARWGRPIVPIVFGVEDETLRTVKGAFEAVVALAGHKMAETDPELGANCMVFFFLDWQELLEVPDLDRLIPDLGPLVERLVAADANQYRIFRFEEDGSIRAAFVFLKMDRELSEVPAETLALSQVVQTIILWSDSAFRAQSPLAVAGETTILRPEIAALIRAAYDPVLPGTAQDPSHALRLFARLELPQ